MSDLLALAVEQIMGSAKESAPPVVPELDRPNRLHIGKPGEALKRVRKRITDLRDEEQTELKAKADKLREEIKSERDIASRGDFDLKAELDKGTSRKKLAEMRAAGDIATGIVNIREDELDDVRDEIDRIGRRWTTKNQQAMGSIQSIQAAYLAYLQAYCGGDRHQIRLNPERQVRAYRTLLTTEESLRKLLKDEQLVTDLMEEITTLEIPSSYQALLWGFLTERDQAQFEGYEPTKLTSREQ